MSQLTGTVMVEMDIVWLDIAPAELDDTVYGYAMEARDAGAVGVWLLDEDIPPFLDRSGGGKSNDGVMTAGTGYGTTKIVPNIEACVDFDGSDDRITITDQSAIQDVFAGGGTFYSFAEVDSDGGGNEGRVASKGGVWEIRIVDDDGTRFRVEFEHAFSGTNGIWRTDRIPLLGSSGSIAVAYNSDDVGNNPSIIVRNAVYDIGTGNLTETQAPVGTATTDVGSDLILGNRAAGDRGFDGRLCAVALFPTILSDTVARTTLFNAAGSPGADTQGPGYVNIRNRLRSLDVERGRAAATDEFQAGKIGFTLHNEDGRYSPYNQSGPLWPYVRPGVPVKIQARYLDTYYDIFTGRCSPVSARTAPGPGGFTISFEGFDAFESLRLGYVNINTQENKRIDEILDAILDDITHIDDSTPVYSSALRDFDQALETISYFTAHNRLPINALQLAARQELGGCFFVKKDGVIRFANRLAKSEATTLIALTDNFDDFVPSMRQEDVVERVTVRWPRWTVPAAAEEVWRINTPLALPAGTSTLTFDILGVGATSYQDPTDADWETNSAEDGTGTNKDAQVAATVASFSSGHVTYTVVNSDSATVYLMPGSIGRAIPLAEGGEEQEYEAEVVSTLIPQQVLTEAFEWNDNEDSVKSWADYQAAARSFPSPRPSRAQVTISPDTDALMVAVLDAELCDRITIQDDGAPWLTGLGASSLFIEGINLSWDQYAQGLTAIWTLFDGDIAMGNFFRISGATTPEYSAIVSSSAVLGDRIAF